MRSNSTSCNSFRLKKNTKVQCKIRERYELYEVKVLEGSENAEGGSYSPSLLAILVSVCRRTACEGSRAISILLKFYARRKKGIRLYFYQYCRDIYRMTRNNGQICTIGVGVALLIGCWKYW